MYKCFAVRDIKADSFFPPFISSTRGTAIREMAIVARDKNNPVSDFPADYDLYELGDWFPQIGKLQLKDLPELVGNVSVVIEVLNKRGEI